MSARDGLDDARARVCAEAAIALAGIIILVWAASTGKAWMERHFLPDYFHPEAARHALVLAIRFIAAMSGLAAIVWLRPYVGREVQAGRWAEAAGRVLGVLIAIGLALLVSEAALRTLPFKARHGGATRLEPIHRPDARFGWLLVPDHVGTRFLGGRRIEYVSDEFGARVRCSACVIDPQRPSILFTGESIMLGTGLQWNESVPAQVEAQLGVQSVNLAVNAYANDQAYLRLASELRRFANPVAVVSFFMPSLMYRNLSRDRPHLDASLQWHAAVIPWRLQALAQRLFNYSSKADIERGVAVTRAVFEKTAQVARSRGAVAVVLVPRFGPETALEHELRLRILDAGGINYVAVDLDPSWRLSDDPHPDARAAAAMAHALAERLRALGVR